VRGVRGVRGVRVMQRGGGSWLLTWQRARIALWAKSAESSSIVSAPPTWISIGGSPWSSANMGEA